MQTPSIGSRDFARFFRYLSIPHRGRQRINRFLVSQMNTALNLHQWPGLTTLHMPKKKAWPEATPVSPDVRSYHGTSLRTPFFFLLLDSFVLSPWLPESVCAVSVLASVGFAVPDAVVPLVSVPVATAASPPLGVAGAADVDSPGVPELDSGCDAAAGAPEVPAALFSGVVPAGAA